MRRHVLPIALLLLFGSFLAAGRGREFHLAPGGSDRNPGTAAHPFKTVGRALNALRDFRRANPGFGDTVCLFFHAGRYALAAPLVLEPGDGGTAASPTVFAAYRNDEAVISGGAVLAGWRRSRSNGVAAYTAPVPRFAGASPVRQLWVNGQRRPCARLPETGYLPVDSIPGLTSGTEWLDGQTAFDARSADFPATFDPAGAEVVVMNRWVESHLPVTGFDPAGGRFTFSRRSVFRLDKGDPYYVLNSRSGLRKPGQWRYDQERREVTYLPLDGEKPAAVDAVIPVCAQLVRIAGSSGERRPVRHLIFRRLTFSHTEWHFPDGFRSDSRNQDAGGFVQAATGVPAALEFAWAESCAVEQCRVSHIGTYAIEFGSACRGNRVVDCDLTDLGAGGIKIGTKTIAQDPREKTAGNLIAGCNIGGGGIVFHSAIGVWIAQSPRNILRQNWIHDFYYTGISIGWTWGYGPADAAGNLVERNQVDHIGRLADGDGPILADMGGIYTLGFHRGTIIRGNVFHDIAARLYGGWGIYFDEGTTGCLAEQNLVYRTTHGGFHQHYGRDNIVRSNIFAFGRDQQIQRSRIEDHTSFAFEKNIVLWSEGRLFHGDLAHEEMTDSNVVFDRNCYWPLRGAFRADTLTFSAWQARGQDRHSLVADPLFVDPLNDDFRLRPGSPAIALGFVPREAEGAGAAAPGRRRLLYNNDGSNILMAYDSLTPALMNARIDPVIEGGVTTFLHNVNPGQNMGYPSSAARMFRWNGTGKAEGWNLLGRRMGENLERLVRAGRDPVGLVMERARLRGCEALLSFRMNELHDVDKPASPLLSEFWKSHPQFRVGGYEGWGKEALNYAVPRVREYFFSLLREVVERYDLDGLELDFMRFPYYFPYRPDSMEAWAGVMTAFVGRVRELTDSAGTARGRRILLAVRVPSSLAGCAHVGLDPAAWARRGLIDFLTAAPFLSTETDIPIGEFKRACGGLPVYACLEFTIGDRQMTREEKRAAAALLYGAGADGLYLFNYFVAWDAGFAADTEVLSELRDPALLDGKDKQYTLAVPRFPVPGVSLPGVLPLALVPDTEHTVILRTADRETPRAAMLRVECAATIGPGDITVRWNGVLLDHGARPARPQMFPQDIWPASPKVETMLEYAVDPGLLKGGNAITLSARRPLAVERLSLGLRFSGPPGGP